MNKQELVYEINRMKNSVNKMKMKTMSEGFYNGKIYHQGW